MIYLKIQKYRKTCGAIATVNIFRNFGYNVSLTEILDIYGGLKNFNNGLTVAKFADTFNTYGFETVLTRISLKEAKWFAKQPGFSVAVAYCWKYIDKYNVHLVALDKRGNALNVSKYSKLINKRWKETREVWGKDPFVIIIKEK